MSLSSRRKSRKRPRSVMNRYMRRAVAVVLGLTAFDFLRHFGQQRRQFAPAGGLDRDAAKSWKMPPGRRENRPADDRAANRPADRAPKRRTAPGCRRQSWRPIRCLAASLTLRRPMLRGQADERRGQHAHAHFRPAGRQCSKLSPLCGRNTAAVGSLMAMASPSQA